MVKYIVDAKKWFDKINGNTYHSILIYDAENKLIHKSGMTYGYGDHYQQTAKEFLIKSELLDEKDKYNHELLRGLIHFSVSNVSRKKDLDL